MTTGAVDEIHVGIDVGGTFTDIACYLPGEDRAIHFKVPSTPADPARAIVEGLAGLLEEHGLAPKAVVRLAHGTTVGTNALIQRRCGKVAVVTTAGFGDLLEIGRQVRPKVYDVHLDQPPPLVPREMRFEVSERMRADGQVHRPLDEEAVLALGRRLADKDIACVVICFLHSYAFPAHERRAVELLQSLLPAKIHVIASTAVHAEFREYERFSTAVLNGALLTVMNAYLDRFASETGGLGVPQAPAVSQSAGGLMPIDTARRLPVRASLSGPAAGVLGAAHRAAAAGLRDVITLDVGGTSADVSLLVDATPRTVTDHTLAGFPLRLPTLDVTAVGAGGGSIAWIDLDGLLKVGPHSAGARPGPACYGFGGEEATLTDANVVLGRLSQDSLLDGRMPIRGDLAEQAIAPLARRLDLAPTETALGIVRVAAATVVKAIRTVSIERGYDPGAFSLVAFGGAGPLLAIDVARELDIPTVIVPPSPGMLCAEGLLFCDLTTDFVHSAILPLEHASAAALNATRTELAALAAAWFRHEGIEAERRRLEWRVELRYRGQNFELALPLADLPVDGQMVEDMAAGFHRAHEQSYGFSSPEEVIEIVNLKLKAVGVLDKAPLPRLTAGPPGIPVASRLALFHDSRWHDTPVFRRDALAPGQVMEGPAIVEQLDATTLIFPRDHGALDEWGNIVVTLALEGRP